jgi:hypothetical protein
MTTSASYRRPSCVWWLGSEISVNLSSHGTGNPTIIGTIRRNVSCALSVEEYNQTMTFSLTAKVNIGRCIARPFRLIGTQHMRQHLKVHVVKVTVAIFDDHLMPILARVSQCNVAFKINRRLLGIAAFS